MSQISIKIQSSTARNVLTVIFSVALAALTVGGQAKTDADSPRPLTVGQPVEREMKGGEAHSYTLALQAGQFLNVVVEQKGIDVVVALFDSDNKKTAEIDSPNGRQGAEPLSLIVERAGGYRLEIRSPEKGDPSGRYEVKIVELRPAAQKDRDLLAARAAFDEGESLRAKRTIDALRSAIEKYNLAADLFRAAGDQAAAGESLHNAGFIYYNIGEPQKALEYYNQALALRQAGDSKQGAAQTLNAIATVYMALSETQKGLETFLQALEMRRAAGDRNGEAYTLNNIGAVYLDLGDYQKALEYVNQALPIRRAVGDKTGEATSHYTLSAIYMELGQFQRSLEEHQESLRLARETGDKQIEAINLSDIGVNYSRLGDKERAIEYFNQALQLRRAIGDKRGEAIALANLGSTYRELGEPDKSLDYNNQALAILRAVGNKFGEANTLTVIGVTYSEAGEYQKALEYYNQALPLRRAVGDKQGEANTLTNIGRLYFSLDAPKAFEYYNQALFIQRAIGDKTGEAATLSYLSEAWRKAGNPTFEIALGKLSINDYQTLRSNIRGLDKNTQQTFLKSIEFVYRKVADALITGDRLSEAQQVLNLFKDQQYFDFNSSLQTAPLALTARETAFSTEFDQKLGTVADAIHRLDDFKRGIGNRPPTASEAEEIKQRETERQTASDSYQAFLKIAAKQFAAPPDGTDTLATTADLQTMQAALRATSAATKQKTVAVYQLVGKENFRALVITSDTISKVSMPVKADALNERAKRFWALLQTPAYDPTKLGKELYETIFKPLEKQLPKDTKTILWSLDDDLRYVPMAALYDGKQYLVERYQNVVFTRADQERMTRGVSSVWTGTGFGTSNAQTVDLLGDKISFGALPGVTEELKEIFKAKNEKTGILDGEVLPDRQFTKTSFLESLKQHRPVVHIASHFSFRPGDEARSFLLLGDGTAFTLADMKAETNLFTGVELLTLSACNTAAQQPDAKGREIDGFAELAQRLGAGAVMATLWSVSDASTPWLMRDFYATRQSRTGTTKAEALRRAQLALLNGTAATKPLPAGEKGAPTNKLQIVIVPNGDKSGQDKRRSETVYIGEKDAPLYKKNNKKPFAHPYFWSPFILFGNWR